MARKLTKAQEQERAEAVARLKEWLKPGDTVYTIVEHASPSGMSRSIKLVVPFVEEGKVRFVHPNHSASVVLGYKQRKNGEGLVIGGAGMDMGFALVYELGQVLFGDGRALKQEWL